MLKIPENKRSIVSILAVLVIAVSIASMFASKRPPPLDLSNVALDLHEAIGRQAAIEVSKLLSHGGKIVVVMLDKASPPIPSAEDEFSSFIQALGQTSSVVVVSVKRVNPEPLRRGIDTQFFGMPVEVYLDVLAGYHDVDAIVSFLGGPLLTDA